MKKKLPEIFVRNEFNYDMGEVSRETGLACPEPTLTQQQFAEEVDINFIAERYGLTGEMPQVQDMPVWGAQFDHIFDFQRAQQAVIDAKADFMKLPAKMRARFDNDPQRLLTFLQDEGNREEAEFLGLVQKRAQDEPQSPRSEPEPKGKGDLPPPEPKGSGDLPPKTSKKDKTDT